MAHQTGIHGEDGWRADRGPKGCALGPFILLFLAPSGEASCSSLQPRVPGMDTSWGGYRLVYIAGSGCTWMHTARLEVSCVLIWGRMCLCVPVWVFLFFFEGGVYPDVHIWKSVHARPLYTVLCVCAHLDAAWLCLSRLLHVHALVAGLGQCRWHGPSQTSVFPGSMHTSMGVCMCAQFGHISVCVCVCVTMDTCTGVL